MAGNTIFNLFDNSRKNKSADGEARAFAEKFVHQSLYNDGSLSDYSYDPNAVGAASLAEKLCKAVHTSVVELSNLNFRLSLSIQPIKFDSAPKNVSPGFVTGAVDSTVSKKNYRDAYEDFAHSKKWNGRFENSEFIANLLFALTVGCLDSSFQAGAMIATSTTATLAAAVFHKHKVYAKAQAVEGIVHQVVVEKWIAAAKDSGFRGMTLGRINRGIYFDEGQYHMLVDTTTKELVSSFTYKAINCSVSALPDAGQGFEISTYSENQDLGYTRVVLRAYPPAKHRTGGPDYRRYTPELPKRNPAWDWVPGAVKSPA